MNIRRAIPVVITDDPAGTRAFYERFVGFELVMEEDGMMMFASPSVRTTQVIVGWQSETALDPALLSVDISIEVDDVDGAYAEARADGREIVRPIANEPWGIRRFFVREPSGVTINIASHIK